MPRKKKKSQEEKTAENYFQVKENDLKYATEKKVKPLPELEKIEKLEKKLNSETNKTKNIPKTTIEKSYKKPERKSLEKIIKKSSKKRTKKKTSKTIKKFSPQKISLKKNGYELIISEKPQAAMKIADSLGKAKKLNQKGVPYYEVQRNGKTIMVGCAVGHLFTLNQDISGTQIPIFDISWKPNFVVRKKDFTKKYYDVLLMLAKNAGSITVASDYDIEGEVIGWNVVRFICNQKDAARMKFSTLTKNEIEKSYENKSSSINWGQALAGETRHHLDWFYGINLSRALMNSIKAAGSFKIMSIGRVQGPALNLIVKKEKEIQNFIPKDYWQVFITVDDKKNQIQLQHIKDIFNKKELENFKDLIGKQADVQTNKKQEKLPPPLPFNLTTLQTEAYKFYGITPSNTLKAAQSLYLAGLISYPRTSSQKLPASIAYKDILKKIAKQFKVEHLIKKQKPTEGKKSDPAHPSIYPTGETQILSGEEEKIYNLIAKRFLSLFCEDAIINRKKIQAEVDNLKFTTKGMSIQKKAWLEIYPSKQKENQIPDMNGKAEIIDSEIEKKQTQPPKRFSQASIISQLEKKNLGTKATRSSILETLYDRGYVKEKSIEATPLGISLINSLEKFSPIIIDEKLTRHFEKEMDSIVETSETKKAIEKEQKIISEAKQTITKISNQFKENQEKIGEELIEANKNLREQQKKDNTLTQCPKCKKGNLAITYSRKTRRHFIACDAYPDCKTTYSLPPNGIIKPIKPLKLCEHCNFPMLMRLAKGKRPWIFCFNPSCLTNKEWAEKRKNKED